MTVNNITITTNKLGKPVAEIKEYISRGQCCTIKCRDFKPLDNHFLKTDDIHLYNTKGLRNSKKTIMAYQGDAIEGKYITQGVENIKKLIQSIKQGVRVNLSSEEWYQQVFKK